ncbi:MAG: hypothetical protein JNJ54_05945 [Myxococcaceae bacterium]|nr:hypothetical protein [Myxococcaceae bacterium]
MTSPFRTIALWCWYRGAGFHGYQGQQGLRTVQAELLRAFAEAAATRNPVVAGRTDRGVSARMQILSARLEREVPLERFVERLSRALPDDLGLHLAREAAAGFHAAWSATAKEYRYHLRDDVGSLDRLREAAAFVPGSRDFRVFHFKTSEVKTRTVTSLEVLPTASGVTLRFVGAQFARHMVRMLTGGLLAVARGEVTLDTFRLGLDQQVNFHCPTAPAEPLTLWSVDYPAAIDPFTNDERAAFRWPPQRDLTATPDGLSPSR